ncbi:excalibur calcium-binding domain-containing protein [Actinosynnema sp. NPDC051121]
MRRAPVRTPSRRHHLRRPRRSRPTPRPHPRRRPSPNLSSRRARTTPTATPCAPRARPPLYAGQPGYRAGLDRDKDGVACE